MASVSTPLRSPGAQSALSSPLDDAPTSPGGPLLAARAPDNLTGAKPDATVELVGLFPHRFNEVVLKVFHEQDETPLLDRGEHALDILLEALLGFLLLFLHPG